MFRRVTERAQREKSILRARIVPLVETRKRRSVARHVCAVFRHRSGVVKRPQVCKNTLCLGIVTRFQLGNALVIAALFSIMNAKKDKTGA
ncbi:hypothetical protein SDC9_127433 [bioreactor metagenome]|uniref:Uncharacterized protein n=1 Tax=bioreactor metagenome TaxID=1076179 RepID=A0A645CTF6_9ZZZZ